MITDTMTPRSLQPYALIAHFLREQGHRKTLDQFLSECRDVFNADDAARHFKTTPQPPLVPLLSQFEEDRMRERMAAVALAEKRQRDRDDELDLEGNGVFPRKAGMTFEDIHNTNVIAVRTHEMAFPATFLEREGAKETVRSVIVSAAADRTVKLSAAEDGEVINICTHHEAPVLCLDFHPEHPRLLATGSMDSSVALVDAATGRVMQRLRHHAKYVSRLAFTPGTGEYLVTGSYDRTLMIYRRDGPAETSDLVEHDWTDAVEADMVPAGWPAYRKLRQFKFDGCVEALAVLPHSPHTVIVGVRDDNNLHYIDFDTLEDTKVNMNENGDDWVSFSPLDVSPSPSGEYVLVTTSAHTGRLIMFETRTSRQVRTFYDPFLCSASAPGDAANELSQPRSLWHPSGRYLYSTVGGCVIRVFSVATSECVAELPGHKGVVRAIWYHRAGSNQRGDKLVSCAYDRAIRYWELEMEDKADVDMVGI